ncbi:A/G-specific adenine DNA glycosylase [Coprinopsis cinerea okayama7|uniref:A/G-specific adenine DNA glycosylase n=1 Tax=Coprinopsis cinerea (strain Okayama-7 / 130 / ATCC MYA-4618 / FGSC 9003) TaxID=240176 RepID=D6RQE9_COPC7|nr:A/G-specific adenine DNA glycosylase [Coprinopsis cinerea okayama7\|eukprot:XP_002910259.1 A/G-specific adenine DNA glycosylase [Coprinopsis cinerea okayama7\
MPPKRRLKAQADLDDDDYQSGGHESSEDCYDPSDASSSRKARNKRVASRKSAPKRRKVADSAIEAAGGELGELTAWKHSRAMHRISKPEELRKALLEWFDTVRDKRGMPWRKPFDRTFTREQLAQRAYEVWISEIMLQQTQVITGSTELTWSVRFPTIKDLAKGAIDEVNALWKGLGYYSRASRLLAGAQKVVNELGGLLPDNAKDMEAKIPGIGRYSAGAICSIAYGEKAPVLDGNVTRLLSRFLMLYANPKAKGTLDVLWAAADAMVQVPGTPKDPTYQNPGDINQALIELGSTQSGATEKARRNRTTDSGSTTTDVAMHIVRILATQGEPDVVDIEDLCTLCESIPRPVSVVDFPMKIEKKKAREEVDIVNVVEWRSKSMSAERWFLLVKRPEKGLLAGLHEFPTLSNAGSPSRKEMDEIVPAILSQLLVRPPVRLRKAHTSVKKIKSEEEILGSDSSSQTDGLARIVEIVPLGDVVHIFSHVRKTYRTQWVILEGGEQLPALKVCESKVKESKSKVKEECESPVSSTSSSGKEKISSKQKKRRKVQDLGDGQQGKSELAPLTEAKWVLEDDVGNENTSTGVVKIWKLAQSHWSKS